MCIRDRLTSAREVQEAIRQLDQLSKERLAEVRLNDDGKSVLQVPPGIYLIEQFDFQKIHVQSALIDVYKRQVRESVRHDQMERQAVECLLLEADIRLLQKRLAQWEAHINRALRQIPRTEARLLQLYYIEEKTWACCAEEVGYSETAGYFRKVKDRAYENFW